MINDYLSVYLCSRTRTFLNLLRAHGFEISTSRNLEIS